MPTAVSTRNNALIERLDSAELQKRTWEAERVVRFLRENRAATSAPSVSAVSWNAWLSDWAALTRLVATAFFRPCPWLRTFGSGTEWTQDLEAFSPPVVETPRLTDAERDHMLRSVVSSQALEGVHVSYNTASRLLDEVLLEPLIDIG